jgi:hypothetical protein
MPNPETLLAGNQSADEISMVSSKLLPLLSSHILPFQIKNFVRDAAQAVNDIKVENNDELVVPFLIT